jgi:hypothetical protein
MTSYFIMTTSKSVKPSPLPESFYHKDFTYCNHEWGQQFPCIGDILTIEEQAEFYENFQPPYNIENILVWLGGKSERDVQGTKWRKIYFTDGITLSINWAVFSCLLKITSYELDCSLKKKGYWPITAISPGCNPWHRVFAKINYDEYN